MADTIAQERLMPFLLDRLTDDEPQNKLESRERRVINVRQYHRALVRDLSWLLNTSSHPRCDNLEEFPEVARSVLNYGMPDFAGSTESSLTPDLVERMVKAAVLQYEPRLIRGTLQVRAVEKEKTVGNVLAIEIRGQIWAQPLPEALYLKTEVDLETGLCDLKDQLHG